MAVEDVKNELSPRERIALRILAIMYRLINPRSYSHQTDRDLNFIFTGKEKD